MKILRVLNIINEAALFLYIPFVLLDFENMFYNDDINGYITLICITMFFTTFVCFGAIIITAVKKGVGTYGFSPFDLKNVNKAELLLLLGAYTGGMVIFIRNYHADFLMFYVVVSTISLIFVFVEKVIISKTELSPYYRVNLPWYMFPVPFILFLTAEPFFLNRVSEEYENYVGFGILGICGVMMAYLAWHSFFVVDEKNGTIIKNHGILEFFNKGERAIVFDNITHAENRRFSYIIGDETKELKISKLYGSSKRLKRTLEEKGIVFKD